jgi:hypothetical protein
VFRSHVARLMEYLEGAGGVSERERGLIDRAIEAIRAGKAPVGDWQTLAASPTAPWKELEKALKLA